MHKFQILRIIKIGCPIQANHTGIFIKEYIQKIVTFLYFEYNLTKFKNKKKVKSKHVTYRKKNVYFWGIFLKIYYIIFKCKFKSSSNIISLKIHEP